ncbi:hypothetical protein BJ875DRAFT_523896 [Amylocarpus encephaloides]|uniref:Uncharacterized protein n=1 Tax=Amylocarpus encephaloides TaxID=45428 RepID=A0A9P7YPC9_9HELO|nr:hypothetical protein BJ875DRAFT_523896 [Amylocarpus encephaloides]
MSPKPLTKANGNKLGKINKMSFEEIEKTLANSGDIDSINAIRTAIETGHIYGISICGRITHVQMTSGSTFYMEHAIFLNFTQADRYTRHYGGLEGHDDRLKMLGTVGSMAAPRKVQRSNDGYGGYAYHSGNRMCEEHQYLEYVAYCQAGFGEVLDCLEDSDDEEDVLFAEMPADLVGGAKGGSSGSSSSNNKNVVSSAQSKGKNKESTGGQKRQTEHSDDSDSSDANSKICSSCKDLRTKIQNMDNKYIQLNQEKKGLESDKHNKDTELQNNIQTLNETCETLQQEISDLNSSNTELSNSNAAMKLDFDDLQQTVYQASLDLKTRESTINDLNNSNTELANSNDAMKVELDDLQQSVNQVSSDLDAREIFLKDLSLQNDNLRLQIQNSDTCQTKLPSTTNTRYVKDPARHHKYRVRRNEIGHKDWGFFNLLQVANRRLGEKLIVAEEKVVAVNNQLEVTINDAQQALNDKDLQLESTLENMLEEYRKSSRAGAPDLRVEILQSIVTRTTDEKNSATSKLAAVTGDLEALRNDFNEIKKSRDHESGMNFHHESVITVMREQAARVIPPPPVIQRTSKVESGVCCRATKATNNELREQLERQKLRNETLTFKDRRQVDALGWERRTRENETTDSTKLLEETRKNLEESERLLSAKSSEHAVCEKALSDGRMEKSQLESDFQKEQQELLNEIKILKYQADHRNRLDCLRERRLADPQVTQSATMDSLRGTPRHLNEVLKDLKNPNCPPKFPALSAGSSSGKWSNLKAAIIPPKLPASSAGSSSGKKCNSKAAIILPRIVKAALLSPAIQTVSSEKPKGAGVSSDHTAGGETDVPSPPVALSLVKTVLWGCFDTAEYLFSTGPLVLRILNFGMVFWFLASLFPLGFSWDLLEDALEFGNNLGDLLKSAFEFGSSSWDLPKSTLEIGCSLGDLLESATEVALPVVPTPSIPVASKEVLSTLQCVVEPFCGDVVSWCPDIIYVCKSLREDYHLRWYELFEPEPVVRGPIFLCALHQVWAGVKGWFF